MQGLNPEEYTVLNSIPGIGKVYSAGILAEIGSVKAFQNANSLANTAVSSGMIMIPAILKPRTNA